MTFVPARLSGDRITLKDGSHWTIAKCFGRLGIDDHYEVAEGGVERLVYSDEIASPAPVMRGRQSFGRAFRPAPPVSLESSADWPITPGYSIVEMVDRGELPDAETAPLIMDFETHSCVPLRLGKPSRIVTVCPDVPYLDVPIANRPPFGPGDLIGGFDNLADEESYYSVNRPALGLVRPAPRGHGDEPTP